MKRSAVKNLFRVDRKIHFKNQLDFRQEILQSFLLQNDMLGGRSLPVEY
jgi:hypothetical protein